MKKIELTLVAHNRKIGDECEYIEPNVKEDSFFYSDGQLIGFYLQKMPDKMCALANLANAELQSNRVPKQGTKRSESAGGIVQESCIIGSVPPKPHMRRPYASISSTHSVKSAQTFIKAMLMLARESEEVIKQLMPEQHEQQTRLLSKVPERWRFGNLFTSSISNFNISAPFHRDGGNIEGAVNVIICKKRNSRGGDLHVPDYNATIGQQDNSMLVYPAWRNLHGVTPIIPTSEGGYRNSLVFYPLKAFANIQ